MRAADRPAPTFTRHDPATPRPWPAMPRLVLEGPPVPPYVWDDTPAALWDDPANVWDAPWGAEYVDMTCDLYGVDVEHGPLDGLWPASSLLASVDNTAGQWTTWTPTGELADSRVGRRVALVAEYAGDVWWLFGGHVTGWDDLTTPGAVALEAFSSVETLAHRLIPWTPGAPGDTFAQRVAAVLSATQPTQLHRVDRPGAVAYTRQETDQTAWDELAVVALSEGGIVIVDTDDTLIAAGRDWIDGRTDQTFLHTITSNACTEPGAHVLWDVVLRADDDHLATVVDLVNVAGVRATATIATGPTSPLEQRITVTHPRPDQWTTGAEGDTLARLLLDRMATARVRVDSAAIYLHDDRFDMWTLGLDTRPGDRVRVVHLYPTPDGPGRLDVDAIVGHLAHSITPDQWIVTLGTSPAVAWRPDPDGPPVGPPVTYPYVWDADGALWDDVALWDIPPDPIPISRSNP